MTLFPSPRSAKEQTYVALVEPQGDARLLSLLCHDGRYRTALSRVVIKGPWWVSCASWLVHGGVLETSLWSRAEQFVGLDVRIELWGRLLNAARLLWACREGLFRFGATLGVPMSSWRLQLSIRAYPPASCATSRGRAGEAERQESLILSGTSIASGYAGCSCRSNEGLTHLFYANTSPWTRVSRISPSTTPVQQLVPPRRLLARFWYPSTNCH